MRLARVLDHRDAGGAGDLQERVEVDRGPVEVDGDHAAGLGADVLGHDLRGQQVRALVDVDEARRRPDEADGLGGRDEGVGRHDDLVAGPDAERAQGEDDRLGPGGDADRRAGRRTRWRARASKRSSASPIVNAPVAAIPATTSSSSATSAGSSLSSRRSGIRSVVESITLMRRGGGATSGGPIPSRRAAPAARGGRGGAGRGRSSRCGPCSRRSPAG